MRSRSLGEHSPLNAHRGRIEGAPALGVKPKTYCFPHGILLPLRPDLWHVGTKQQIFSKPLKAQLGLQIKGSCCLLDAKEAPEKDEVRTHNCFLQPKECLRGPDPDLTALGSGWIFSDRIMSWTPTPQTLVPIQDRGPSDLAGARDSLVTHHDLRWLTATPGVLAKVMRGCRAP